MKRHQPSAKPKLDSKHQLRIIAGQWRSRRFAFPAVEGLRPSSDRVRETLFNWLNADIPASRCLDLFAGSGALGLEALSRGAEHLLAIELNNSAAQALNGHIQDLGAQAQADIINQSALDWLQNTSLGPSFDVIFLDPPFKEEFIPQSLQLIAAKQLLKPHGVIYFEAAKRQDLGQLPDNWEVSRHKQTSQIQFGLIRRID